MPEAPAAKDLKPSENKELQSIAQSLFGATMTDDFKLAPLPDEEPVAEPPPETPPATPAAEKPPETPPVEPAVAPPAAEPPPAEPAVVVTKPVSEQVLEIQKRIESRLEEFTKIQAAPPAPAAPAPAATPPAPNPDEAFEATLPEENREILDLLKWGGEKFPEHKGKAEQMRAYFKKEEEFLKTGPDAEAIEEFRKANRPAVAEGVIRKLNRDKLKEEAVAEAKAVISKETNAELEALREKQRVFEIQPVVKEATNEFVTRFAAPKITLPKEVAPIRAEVAKEIEAGGLRTAVEQRTVTPEFQKVMEKYPTEAPIIYRHALASDEYLKLVHGLTPYDPTNETHGFLQNFIAHQEQVLLGKPEAAQVRDGKKFLPTAQFTALEAKDPKGTREKYWMFSDAQIRNMLEVNAHYQVNLAREKIRKEAESMGYVLKEEPAAAAVVADPPQKKEAEKSGGGPAKPAEPTPKGGTSRSPGAASGAPNAVPGADLLTTLGYPIPASR